MLPGRRKERSKMNGPKITQTRAAFALVCGVEVNIRASAPAIWRLLTDAQGFPRWNSTVANIEGEISEDQRLRVRVPGSERSLPPRSPMSCPTSA